MPEDTQFDPQQKGALYQKHSPRWQLETDVAEMTLDVLNAGTYLRMFSSKEHADDYAYRKSMSVPLDMCRDGVRIRIDNLWRTAPKRDFDKSPHKAIIEQLVNDADNGGTGLDDFMRRAVWNHYVTGVDIVTQTTAGDGQPVETKLDEKAQGLRPYWMQFSPLDRYDWAVTGTRNFLWARYCLGAVEEADEQTGNENEIIKFLTVGPTYWRTYLATRPKEGTPGDEKSTKVEMTEGAHTFGTPPIVKFYFTESQKSGQGAVPLSLLTRPAVVAKVMLNLKSQADADLIAAVTRWFATGVQGEDLPDTISPNVLVKFPNPDSRLSVLQGDVGHIAEKRQWLLLYIGEILRLLKFRGGMAEISASSGSGLKLAIERTDLDNELRATAATCERIETEMMRQAVSLATGTVIPPEGTEDLGYSVQYNRDFVLEPVGEMLDNLRKWVKDCGLVADSATEITKEMLRQLANMLAREGTPPHDVIMKQIEVESFEDVGASSAKTEEKVTTEDEGLKPPTAGE